MHVKTDTQLASVEIGTLWTTYMNDSMAVCALKYFLEKVKDTDIRPAIEYALGVSQKHVQDIAGFFSKEGYPIPHGFTDEDVDVSVPPLFHDTFYLLYLRYLGTFGLNAYGVALPIMARRDIVDFFTQSLNESIELTRKITATMQSLGVFMRSPIIEIPDKIDFVKKENFFAGFLGRRKLTTIEIAHIYANIKNNISGKALVTGFAQVAESDKVKNLMVRGKSIASKNIDVLSNLLKEDDIPASMIWDSFVTTSTETPFSDKLMLFHTTVMNAAGIGNYGTALSTSMRHDIQVDYARLTSDIAQYASDCVSVMIENGWLEQPPQAIDHEALAKV